MLTTYTQSYQYDHGNNLINTSHQTNTNHWQNQISIAKDSNRGVPIGTSFDAFDNNGNITHIDHVGQISWNTDNKLQAVTKANGDKQYYVYNAQGKRVRKISCYKKTNSAQETRYLGSLNIHLKNNTPQQQNLRIANIATNYQTLSTKTNTTSVSYQLTDYLNSALIELDQNAKLLSFESYFPFGGSSVIAGISKQRLSLKDYRYTNKECDDFSGLYYYGGRYLMSWQGRWLSPDPARTVNGLNLYAYVTNNPINHNDPSGYARGGAGVEEEMAALTLGESSFGASVGAATASAVTRKPLVLYQTSMSRGRSSYRFREQKNLERLLAGVETIKHPSAAMNPTAREKRRNLKEIVVNPAEFNGHILVDGDMSFDPIAIILATKEHDGGHRSSFNVIGSDLAEIIINNKLHVNTISFFSCGAGIDCITEVGRSLATHSARISLHSQHITLQGPMATIYEPGDHVVDQDLDLDFYAPNVTHKVDSAVVNYIQGELAEKARKIFTSSRVQVMSDEERKQLVEFGTLSPEFDFLWRKMTLDTSK